MSGRFALLMSFFLRIGTVFSIRIKTLILALSCDARPADAARVSSFYT